MRRSFVRLTVQSVLLFWGALFLAAGWYAATRPWTHEDAQRTGALLAYEDLERTPSSKRASRLEVLRQHYSYPSLTRPSLGHRDTLQDQLPTFIEAQCTHPLQPPPQRTQGRACTATPNVVKRITTEPTWV
ncbi:MAG: hypothetical protein AAFX99_26815 [Myxococcota bacterium]